MAQQPLVGQGLLIIEELGRTPLDEWSVRNKYLHLTTHNTHKRQTPMSAVWFEPTVPACERFRPTPWTLRPLGSA